MRLAYDTMPEAVKPKSEEDNVRTLSFKESRSKIFVSLKVESTALHNLHISEYPLCEETAIGKTIAACPPHANISFEGVAEGLNHAETRYRQMKDEARAIFHPWFLQEEYRLSSTGIPVIRTKEELEMCSRALRDYAILVDDEQILFRRKAKQDLKQLFDQEMAEDDIKCFLTTGNPFFNNMKIKKLMHMADQHINVNTEFELSTEHTCWERPDPNCVYVAGADVAEGVEGDYSVLTILNVTHRRQAFRYHGRIGVDAFYRICDKWSRAYNNALLAVESNNHGHAVLLGLREDCRYPNLYRRNSPYAASIFSKDLGKKQDKYGWETTSITKTLMLDQIKQAIEGQFEADENNFEPEFLVLDKMFLDEALHTVNREGKIGASAGKHDDIVMAWAIAFQMYLICRKDPYQDSIRGWHVGGKREII